MVGAPKALAKLTIEIVQLGGDPVEVVGFPAGMLEVEFNPTEYSIDRETTFAEVAVPGLDAPVLQYVRGGGDKMTVELFLDTTDTMVAGVAAQSVRETYVAPLERLMVQHERLHAPPAIRLLWGSEVLIARAVVFSLSVKYTLFDNGGRPVRATANLTLRQHTSAAEQIAEANLQSPDKTNVARVREGDTLPAIAFRYYGDAAAWRPIATANRLSNPLALEPGSVLVVPKIV